MTESYYDKSLSEQLRYQQRIHAEKCGKIDYGPCAMCRTLLDAAKELDRSSTEGNALKDAARELLTYVELWLEDYDSDEPQAEAFDRLKRLSRVSGRRDD